MSELDVYWYDERGYEVSFIRVNKNEQKKHDKEDLYVELEEYEKLEKELWELRNIEEVRSKADRIFKEALPQHFNIIDIQEGK